MRSISIIYDFSRFFCWSVVATGLGHLDRAGEGGADLPEGKDGMDLM